MTINAEFLGRTLNDGGRLTYRTLPMGGNPFGITNATIASVDWQALDAPCQ